MLSVIKLGGSLLETETLPDCLRTIQRRAGRIAMVTGGGLFAEQVRLQQERWQFDERAAHRMALLSMQQMALLCQSFLPEASLFYSVADFAKVKGIGIWMPQIDELDAHQIPASWEVTSDSLAAWLAGRLNADMLNVVKAAPVERHADLTTLQTQGLLDDAFLRFAEPKNYAINVLSQQDFVSAP
ncbi:MAG: hypothetical protein RL563_2007 [Pseudomonadota bacterium]|jgi:aspartokinase-like uncharacterized kinase